jgi:aminopeptidase N
MKRVLWIVGMIVLVVLLVAAGVTGYFVYRYGKLGLYASGGALSDVQSSYDVIQYDVVLHVYPDDKKIAGKAGITVRIWNPISSIELDLLHQLNVTAVSVDGASTSFERDEDKLWVRLPESSDAVRTVHVVYDGQPLEALRPPWIGGFNWSRDADGRHWIGLSCQGEGAKIWMPCKDHPSDEPDSVTLSITVPRPYVVVANGLLRGIDSSEADGLTYRWGTNYPINNYSINFSVGLYRQVQRTYRSNDGGAMPVIFYYLRQSSAYADRHVDMAVDMLKTYRKFFGEYPFFREKFSVVETDYLGMEHQTVNAYGNRFRYDTLQGHGFDELMLHEMGHEWWGNNVTVDDWADFWIHEGICTYGEALYHLDKTGESGYHAAMASVASAVKNRQPILPKRPASSVDAYSPDIYTKGAALMHSLRYILGDSLFFPFLKSFATDSSTTYRNLVSTEKFLQRLGSISPAYVVPYALRFLQTTDIPHIRIASAGDGVYEIRLNGFELPMDIITDRGLQRVMLSDQPVRFYSAYPPRVDPRNWYVKAVQIL